MDTFGQLINKEDERIKSTLTIEEGDLQRTEQWYQERKGVLTGSKISDLMACPTKTSRKEWGLAEKTIDFGETAMKYIYSKYMERKTGKVIKQSDLFQFAYGRAVEGAILELFIEQKPFLTYQAFGFTKVNEYLGASPDAGFIDNENGVFYGGEIKGAMKFETYYERTQVPFDRKHKDFWQVMTEMLAQKCDELYYITAEPVEDPIAVVKGELTKDEIKEAIGSIDIQLIKSSEIHQQCILDRAKIGNTIVEYTLGGMNFREAKVRACGEWMEKQETK